MVLAAKHSQSTRSAEIFRKTVKDVRVASGKEKSKRENVFFYSSQILWEGLDVSGCRRLKTSPQLGRHLTAKTCPLSTRAL